MKTLGSYRYSDRQGIKSIHDEGIEPLAECLKRGNLAFVLGAGISIEYPSLLPLVVNIPGALPGLLNLTLNSLADHASMKEANQLVPRLQESLLLEHVLNHLHRVLGDRAFEFLAPLDARKRNTAPNFRHRALMALGAVGLCNRFVTVNFDTLLEDSAEFPLFCPEKMPDEAQAYESISINDARCLLLKLHGSIERPKQLLTTVELVAGGLPPHKIVGLSKAIGSRDLCFMGYRDSDLDVFPAIQSVCNAERVFWYEFTDDGGEPTLPAEVEQFLRTRDHHTIYSGDLSSLLAAILKDQGISAGDILTSIGVKSFHELHRRDVRFQDTHGPKVKQLIAEVARQELSNSAARLALSLMAGGRPHLEKRLLDGVRQDDLEPIALSAYWTARAQRVWKLGKRKEDVACRRRALTAAKEGEPSNTLRRWKLEYRIKLAKAQWRSGRIGARLGAVWQILRVCKALRWDQLDHYSYGATKSMLIALKGREEYKMGLGQLAKAALAESEGKDFARWWHRSAAHFWFRRAVRSFRFGRKVKYQSQGWLRMHLLGVGQALTHLKGKVRPEARQAIRRAAKLGVNPATQLDNSNPQGHAGLVLAIYGGDIDETARQLAYTWWYNRRVSRYLGGLRETYLLYLVAEQHYEGSVVDLARRCLAMEASTWQASQ